MRDPSKTNKFSRALEPNTCQKQEKNREREATSYKKNNCVGSWMIMPKAISVFI